MEATPQQNAEGLAIVQILSAVLDRLVYNNSNAPTDHGEITKFHALQAPGIGILQYLERIHKYASCSNECFILALIYIDRLIQRKNFYLTELNVHRVVLTAILLAAKFFDDAYYNNAYYSKVGGVLVSEMNGLEVDFLFRINFSLHVTPDVFQQYKDELLSHCIANEPPPPPLSQVQEEIAPSSDQVMSHNQLMTAQYQMHPISCPPGMPVQPPAPPSQVTPSSSHSTSHMPLATAAAVAAQHQHQPNMFEMHDSIPSHTSTVAAAVTAAAAAAAAANMYFPNNFHNPTLQRANSLPAVQTSVTRCSMNPPYSAPMVSMVRNTIENDSYLVVDNLSNHHNNNNNATIYPIQNALIHHHHGLVVEHHYPEVVNFQTAQDGGYRDSLVAGHY
eukprot:CAMPEP_0119570592 /NCGR_PEP_ID=MMETSP1352-20130426/43692_1 /TAXON_ID=265584 /ORGANISM="Stauroneis constricta, Strain CCMP1120" /LENGTH=389 /DNA_ID=CAMNT_0007620261 /DNA_START=1096 /DNA_END=2265 /DNA_ORIENTATION=-